jgi:hypothetical protein
MTEWRVNVNDGEFLLTETEGLYDVIVSDTFNPFGNYAKAFVDDLNARTFDAVRRGTKVAFEYDNSNTTGFTQRFVGFVVNDLAQEADGAEQVEIEAYSFDQFLRGNEVSNDQSGKDISTALEDVIKTDVAAVSWDAVRVSVVDDQELTQSYQGESVEEFLLSIRQKSAGETFGVNNNLTFVFKIAEANRPRRDIDNSQWVTHDIGEESGETRNQVTVYYGSDGEQAVTIDNAEDQLRVGANLNTNGPAQQGTSITRTDIETATDAIAAGKSFLQGRQATLTGTVTTFELNDAVPGETIGVTIEPRGIDTDFRVAANRIQWRGETNELTVVQKKGADDDILIEQSKTLQRLERANRQPDTLPDKITDTEVECQIKITGGANGVPFEITRLTNKAKNTLVKSWTDELQPQFGLQEFVLSTSDKRPSRSDSSFDSAIATSSFSVSLPSANSIEFTASVSATNVRSIGLAENGLFFIGRLEEAVDNPTITMRIDVETGSNNNQAAVLDAGQEHIRDIINPNTIPTLPLPTSYEYGSGTTDVSETDTSLSTVTQLAVANKIVNVESGLSFEDAAEPIDGTTPVNITTNGIELTRTAWIDEGETLGSGNTVSNVDLSDGAGLELTSIGSAATLTINVDHTIPAGEWAIVARGIRLEDTGDPPRSFDAIWDGVNGDFIGNIVFDATTPTWDSVAGNFDIAPGTYDVRLELGSNGDSAAIDLLGFVDKRYVPDISNFDNTVHQDNGYLDDPQLFPNTQTVSLKTLEFPLAINSITISQIWNDISEDQAITVTPPGSTSNNFSTVQITTTELESTRRLQIDVRLSNYPSGTAQSATPRFEYNGQRVEAQEVEADIFAARQTGIGEVTIRSRVRGDENVGDNFAESGQNADGTLLTRARNPEFSKQSGQAVIANETLRWVNHPEN